ncbi:hypothetical protein BLJ79_13765 [Arthrobacter sp. UCD-GKA]|nr:hypothetical protein BLJ79_13765 [Arthrobacter sp. UCD-GKA]
MRIEARHGFLSPGRHGAGDLGHIEPRALLRCQLLGGPAVVHAAPRRPLFTRATPRRAFSATPAQIS